MAHKPDRITQPAHVLLAAALDPELLHGLHGLTHRFEFACDLIVNPKTKEGLVIPDGHDLITANLAHLFEKLDKRKGGATDNLRNKFNRVIGHVDAQKAKHAQREPRTRDPHTVDQATASSAAPAPTGEQQPGAAPAPDGEAAPEAPVPAAIAAQTPAGTDTVKQA